jgi:hypothetical protein
MCVSLGVYSYYDLNDGTPAYNYGNWEFVAIAGDSGSTYNNAPVSIQSPLMGTECLDYGLSSQWYTNYYDYSSGTWTNGYDHNGSWYNMGYYGSVDHYQYGCSLSDRTSIEGTTQGEFFFNIEPGTYYYYWAYTQIPNGHSVPPGIQSYAFLTAHQSGDW